MELYDEMDSKYGFNDGADVPFDAYVYRDAYVKTINKIAEQVGSEYRAVEYDRPGFHNPCLILFCRIDKDQIVDNLVIEQMTDDKMHEAIALAHGVDIDYFVYNFSDDELDDFIDAIDINEIPQETDPNIFSDEEIAEMKAILAKEKETGIVRTLKPYKEDN